jgi:hypothetical protein
MIKYLVILTALLIGCTEQLEPSQEEIARAAAVLVREKEECVFVGNTLGLKIKQINDEGTKYCLLLRKENVPAALEVSEVRAINRYFSIK